MNPWWLLLIVPICILVGVFAVCVEIAREICNVFDSFFDR